MSNVNTVLKCPRDGEILISSNKNGIEIEYCPTCGGVWLDHGELEKLIALASQPKFGPPDIQSNQHKMSSNEYSSGYHKPQKHKKKENWLGEIFDF
jgi:uncharacterized protein